MLRVSRGLCKLVVRHCNHVCTFNSDEIVEKREVCPSVDCDGRRANSERRKRKRWLDERVIVRTWKTSCRREDKYFGCGNLFYGRRLCVGNWPRTMRREQRSDRRKGTRGEIASEARRRNARARVRTWAKGAQRFLFYRRRITWAGPFFIFIRFAPSFFPIHHARPSFHPSFTACVVANLETPSFAANPLNNIQPPLVRGLITAFNRFLPKHVALPKLRHAILHRTCQLCFPSLCSKKFQRIIPSRRNLRAVERTVAKIIRLSVRRFPSNLWLREEQPRWIIGQSMERTRSAFHERLVIRCSLARKNAIIRWIESVYANDIWISSTAGRHKQVCAWHFAIDCLTNKEPQSGRWHRARFVCSNTDVLCKPRANELIKTQNEWANNR